MPKINGIDVSRIASVGANRPVARSSEETGGASGDEAATTTADVQITGAARNLAKLEQTVRDLPVVDESRVAHIRAQLEQGTYSVRPQHVADQLMSLERSLSSLPDGSKGDQQGEGNPPQSGR